MFWNKKIKSTVSEADEKWLNESLTWLRETFQEEHFQGIQTITPTKNFYNRTFDRTENDAYFILDRTKELMAIDNDEIQLEFFSNSPTILEDGSMLSTPSDNVEGSWKSAAGTYEQKEGKEVVLSIEIEQLNNTMSLIATISHELAHEILLGEGWTEENDEYLTDLTAIFYGFGVFLGNSQFMMSSFGNGVESGWETRSQGYLPQQVIAYAMAWLSFERGEELHYTQFLSKSMKKFVEQNWKYLKSLKE